MAWTDKPTDAQIGCIFRWLSWRLPLVEATEASNWLRENATRREAFDEMGRIKKLYESHNLNRETAFQSDVWNGYLER